MIDAELESSDFLKEYLLKLVNDGLLTAGKNDHTNSKVEFSFSISVADERINRVVYSASLFAENIMIRTYIITNESINDLTFGNLNELYAKDFIRELIRIDPMILITDILDLNCFYSGISIMSIWQYQSWIDQNVI